MNIAPRIPLSAAYAPAAQSVVFDDRPALDGSFAALLKDFSNFKAEAPRIFAFTELGVFGQRPDHIMPVGGPVKPIEWDLTEVRRSASATARPAASPASTELSHAPHAAMQDSDAGTAAPVEAATVLPVEAATVLPVEAAAATQVNAAPAPLSSGSPHGLSVHSEQAPEIVRQPEVVLPNPSDIFAKPGTKASSVREFCGHASADVSEPDQPGRAKAFLREQREPLQRAQDVSLAVSGPPDALMIIARATSETAEDRLRLKKLVEELVREFGMRVAEFHLNGSAAQSSTPFILGGSHGTQRN